MRELAWLLLVGACSFKSNGSGTKDGSVVDGHEPDTGVVDGRPIDGRPIDGRPIDSPPAPTCVGSGAFEICIPGSLTGTVTLPGTLDTDTDTTVCNKVSLTGGWFSAGQPASCIVAGHDIVTAGTVASGSAALVLVAIESIGVDGVLDVSSHIGSGSDGSGDSDLGAGHATGSCGSGILPGVDGGGAGGSFMTVGGLGGAVIPTATGGVPGSPLSNPPLLLRGGCAGQNGNTGSDGSAAGGAGGGALYLAAGSAIDLGSDAEIDASGAGGGISGNNGTGGAGGGTGGMIVFDAPSIDAMVGSIVLANGGGGAQGGDNTHDGAPGGEPTLPTTPAPGGSGAGGGGTGGNGFGGPTQAAGGGNGGAASAAGGGGGGAGYIHTSTALGSGAQVSPNPS